MCGIPYIFGARLGARLGVGSPVCLRLYYRAAPYLSPHLFLFRLHAACCANAPTAWQVAFLRAAMPVLALSRTLTTFYEHSQPYRNRCFSMPSGTVNSLRGDERWYLLSVER